MISFAVRLWMVISPQLGALWLAVGAPDRWGGSVSANGHPTIGTGIYRTGDLEGLGVSRTERGRLLEAGTLHRLVRGWYAVPDHHAEAAAAIRTGARLTCVSALAKYGVWKPEVADVHVRYRRGASTSLPPGMLGHTSGDQPLGMTAIDDVPTALGCVWTCLDARHALAIADSVAQLGLLRAGDIRALAVGAPRQVRRALRYLDGRAESGTETLVRYELQRRGYRVRTQVRIPRVGFTDMLVGDRVIIECDSWAHHSGAVNYVEDRRRDLEALAQGYLVIRVTYGMVVHDWDRTWARIEAILRERAHRDTSLARRLTAVQQPR